MYKKRGVYYLVTSERLKALMKVAPKYNVKVKVVAGPGKMVETESGFKGIINNNESYVELLPKGSNKINAEEILGVATDVMGKGSE